MYESPTAFRGSSGRSTSGYGEKNAHASSMVMSRTPAIDCDGTVLPSDDPWWDDHSPDANHPNCRCITVPLSAEEAKREGIDNAANVGEFKRVKGLKVLAWR